MSSRSLVVLGIAGLLALSSCSSSSPESAADLSSTGQDAPLTIAAAFYPLEFAVAEIGGSRVAVTPLTKPGAEPHDVELSARDVAELQDASLIVFSTGFQPAVDEAIAQNASPDRRVLDVSESARLTLAAPEGEHEGEHEGEEGEHEGGEPGNDPHFWLDPTRYADVATAIAAELSALDPAGATTYAANLEAFTDELAVIDDEFTAGTSSCRIPTLVTAHAAFGYLADRYGFTQVPISGLSPDVEPSAAQLAAVSDLVRRDGITTVYSETLVDPKFAQTVAAETGAALATLDPIEGVTETSAGSDYREIMRSNLATLRVGQDCA